MNLSNNTRKSFNLKTLGLPLATVLMTAGLAAAHGNDRAKPIGSVSGHVEVVKHVPGGVVTVGAEWGRPRPVNPPTVVVVEQRPQVVVVEKVRPQPRKVVVVREAPRRHVTVVKDRGHHHGHKKVVVVKKKDSHGRHNHHDGRGKHHGNRQISHSKNGPNGQYHYYEDAKQISISDNRHGRQEHVYVRK